MSLINFSIIASAVIKIVVLLLYTYLFWHYRERYLGLWAVAWACILLKSALDPFGFEIANYTPIMFVFQAAGLLCILFLAWGTADFVGRRMNPYLVYTAVVLLIITNIGQSLDWPIYIIIAPTILMYGLIYVYTGVMLLRYLDTPGAGRKITAYAFIAIGLHQFDFPLFRPTDMAPWGYLFDSSLRLVVAVGFLLTYFEKTRYDLAKKEEEFRLLAENARDIIFRFLLKPRFRLHYISPAAEAITGYKPEAFYANTHLLYKIVHPEDRPLIWKNKRLALQETPVVFRMLTREQKQIWVELHFTLLRGDGATTAVEGIIRDVTARKELEQELFRLDRLNIVGQMAANIGHEIRNPLTTVRGYLQVMSRKRELEQYGDNFRLLLEELDRANALITEYLSLSKNRLTDQQSCSLNAIVRSLFPLILADAASTNHVVRLELGDIPELMLDEKEIRQLLLNLVRNGLEAMEPGKALTVSTHADECSVILAVQNEGSEIPADVLEKLGMPFFTTKEKGTGLGLAICYSIANRHRAKIHIDTNPQGTTFSVVFTREN
jgi:two-component system sporulation sensor kinase C